MPAEGLGNYLRLSLLGNQRVASSHTCNTMQTIAAQSMPVKQSGPAGPCPNQQANRALTIRSNRKDRNCRCSSMEAWDTSTTPKRAPNEAQP